MILYGTAEQGCGKSSKVGTFLRWARSIARESARLRYEQSEMFSYVTLERRIPADHPLVGIRMMVDRALVRLSAEFAQLCGAMGRPSLAPKRLLRALLLHVLYSVRSKRQLMEQLQYNLLFRWFVA